MGWLDMHATSITYYIMVLALAWFASTFCEFLRIALVVFIERGTPALWTWELSRDFRETFANLSQNFRTKSFTTQKVDWQTVTSRNLLGTTQRLFVSNSYIQGILPEPSRNLPEHTPQLQFHSSIHEQTRQISHIVTFQLSRLSRSTFAFAIFREPAFSFRAGTPG